MPRSQKQSQPQRRQPGSVYQRKDGRWVASVTLGYETDAKSGKRKRVSQDMYFHSEPEAEKWRKQAVAELAQGTFIIPDNLTTKDYLTDWLEGVVKQTREPASYYTYESTLRIHVIPLIGPMPLQRLTSAHIQQMYTQLSRQGVSRSNVARVKLVFGVAWRHALKLGLVARDIVSPTVAPRVRADEMQVWTKEEASAFLHAAHSHRLYGAFLIALVLGMRVGEYLGLRWQDVDFQKRQVRVAGMIQHLPAQRGLIYKDVKTPSSRRTLPLPDLLVTALEEHRERQAAERIEAQSPRARGVWRDSPYDYVFTRKYGGAISPTTFRGVFAKLCVKAGVRQLTVHSMRHAAATYALLDGVPIPVVSKLLGHRSIQQTLSTYAHVIDTSFSEASVRLDGLWGGLLQQA